MANNKPLELYFTHNVRIRGEHILGENAKREDGKINMVIVKRGEIRRIVHSAENFNAQDLVIAGQAVDAKTALADAKQANADHEKYVNFLETREKTNQKKAA